MKNPDSRKKKKLPTISFALTLLKQTKVVPPLNAESTWGLRENKPRRTMIVFLLNTNVNEHRNSQRSQATAGSPFIYHRLVAIDRGLV